MAETLPENSAGAWLARRGSRSRYGLLLLAGLLAALGQAPFSQPWAALAGLTLAFAIFPFAPRAFWSGWAFGLAYFAATLNWIVEPFLVDIETFGWMAPFALVGISVGFALFYGAAFWATRRLGGGRMMLAVWMAAAELLRSYVLTGFPWGLLSYLWVDTPALQLVAWIGPHGLNLVTLLAVALLARGIAGPRPLLGAVPGVVSILAVAFLGFLRPLAPIEPAQAGDRPVVRLVQPNAPQRQKWDPDWIPVFYRRQIALTSEPGEAPVDLVIWPETSLPTVVESEDDIPRGLIDAVSGRRIALGTFRRNGEALYNSMVTLDPQGRIEAAYDKQHLVPFGEYMPFAGLMSRLGIRAIADISNGGFDAGPGPRTVDLGPLGRALPLICYEAIFPQDLRAPGPRPDWLLQITNDAWFGKFAGPYQHLVQTRFRAVEQGLPLLRAANTGVSAVVDANGRILQSLPLGEAGRIDAALPPPLPETLYARTGDWPVPVALLLLLGGFWAGRRRFRD